MRSGKSSSVNSLMGKEVAEEGKWEATTMSVQYYNNDKFTVIDTPGLCDDLEDKNKDYLYLKRMQEEVSRFDCLWFVTPLYETRIGNDEKRAIKLIGQAFGQKVWKNVIVVFTFANANRPDISYGDAYKARTGLIRKEIARWVDPKVAEKVPSVAIDNKSETTPDGKKWLGELYVTVLTHISDEGFLQFLLETATRLEFEEQMSPPKGHYPSNVGSWSPSPSSSPSYISLSSSQRATVAERTQSFFEKTGVGIVGGAVAGAAIGALGGPVGAAIGGAAGALIGGLLSWGRKK